jgi:hypothetical protein
VCQTQTGPTPIPLNGACSTWGVPCVYGGYCGAADGGMTCLPVSTTIGTRCPIEVTACAPPLRCEASPAVAPACGTCAAPAAEGAPCDYSGANVDFPCASLTDACNFKTGTCDPVVSNGASCALGTLCVGRDSCADGYVCLPLPGPRRCLHPRRLALFTRSRVRSNDEHLPAPHGTWMWGLRARIEGSRRTGKPAVYELLGWNEGHDPTGGTQEAHRFRATDALAHSRHLSSRTCCATVYGS